MRKLVLRTVGEMAILVGKQLLNQIREQLGQNRLIRRGQNRPILRGLNRPFLRAVPFCEV